MATERPHTLPQCDSGPAVDDHESVGLWRPERPCPESLDPALTGADVTCSPARTAAGAPAPLTRETVQHAQQ